MQMPQFKITLGIIALFGNVMVTHSVFSAETESMSEHSDKQTIGKMPGISGWYERYGNGQVVLYPAVNLSSKENPYGMMGGMYILPPNMAMYNIAGMGGMYNMFGMGNMPGMIGGMTGMRGMNGMSGMAGMSSMTPMYGMLGVYGITPYQMSFGRFWINNECNLMLHPISSMFDMMGMGGMGGMMGGMGGMSGMK